MLSKVDATLAFAAFGAAHYDSFPIAVLPVEQDKELEEFLLCFNGEVVLASRSCNIWDCVLLNQLGFVMFDSQNHIKHDLSHKAVMNCINVFM